MLRDRDCPALAALAAVLREGRFERAAAAIGVTHSAVSQRIAALEDRLGAVLAVRGRPGTATPAGARLARHAADVGPLEAALAAALGGLESEAAALRLAVNADSLATWVVPALAATPGRLFGIVLDDQGHSADWLRRGEVSAAVTAHARPVQGCDAVARGALRYVATASPGFVARWFPAGPTAAALARAPALSFDAKDRMQHAWAARAAGARVALPAHRLPSATAFVEAALLGLGWAMNPEVLVRGHLAAGWLVALAPEGAETPLAFQWNRLLGAALLPLRRAMLAAACGVPAPPA